MLLEPSTPAIEVHAAHRDRIDVYVHELFAVGGDYLFSVVVTTDPEDPDLDKLGKLHTWKRVLEYPGTKKSWLVSLLFLGLRGKGSFGIVRTSSDG